MTDKRRFNGHDKRVTLNLGRCSSSAREYPGLHEALTKLPAIDWNLDKLDKRDIELIYGYFDEDLEDKIKREFAADPSYLIDMNRCDGVCPLCGHEGLRFLFKIENMAGGDSIECGSTCIITHGLSVKGAETSEEAKRALEGAIRRRLRELEIKAWHDRHPEFPSVFRTVENHIRTMMSDWKTYGWHEIRAARSKLKSLYTLERFYDRYGWLGTEKKWADWTWVISFLRKSGAAPGLTLPPPFEGRGAKGTRVHKTATAKAALVLAPAAEVAKTIVTETSEKLATPASVEEPARVPAVKPVAELVTVSDLTAKIAHDLVFGPNA